MTIANYPDLDKTPPTDSEQVKAWLANIDMSKVPTYNVTDGTCAGTPAAIEDGRCWWTCGGCTRETDITECPDKLTWGVSYDDGPSDYTPVLLEALEQEQIKTTFFVVGSRVLSRPEILQAEYAAGHQISVHTWSHASLTTLTNEELVAELGWTQKVIRDTIGVTPNTFRPPYGDIDDRVRAVAAQMGLTPIMWTSYTDDTGAVTNFDTTDWNIPGGTATGESALSKFETILNEYVPKLTKGFIVLQHDLYQQTVDLAVGYVIPMSKASSNNYVFKTIIDCLGKPASEAYIETSSNTTATQITSAASTFYQPVVGSQTGSAVMPTSATDSAGGASGSGTSGGSATTGSGSDSSSGSSASASPSSGAYRKADYAVVPLVAALATVALGMVVVV